MSGGEIDHKMIALAVQTLSINVYTCISCASRSSNSMDIWSLSTFTLRCFLGEVKFTRFKIQSLQMLLNKIHLNKIILKNNYFFNGGLKLLPVM